MELCVNFRVVYQVDHLSKKPKDGERCLREIQSILIENDISPFEVGHIVLSSGILPRMRKVRPVRKNYVFFSKASTPETLPVIID
jgi:hypothetical protein